MAKKILFIDSDEAFVSGLAQAAAARGHTPLLSTNSEQGITLAKQELPDLIVVCVEAQPTNGYMLCTRLKKDDRLKSIPVILTSANATQDSFEKHKKLKTRAEEYLIKPFEAPALFAKLNPLLGLPPDAPPEEIIEMHDEPMGMGIGDLVVDDDEPIQMHDHDAAAPEGDTFMVDEVEEVVQVDEQSASSEGDPDLQMFDKAFDALEMPGAPPEPPSDTAPIQTMPDHHDEAMALSAEAAHEAKSSAPHSPANSDGEKSIDELLGTLEGEPAHQGGSAELEARIQQLEAELAEKVAELGSAKAQSSGGSAEVTRLKEQRNKQDKEILRLKEELHGKERELVEVQDSQTQLEHQVQVQRDEAVKREAAAKALQQRAEALAAAAKKFERELSAAREELKGMPALKAKVAELEKTAGEAPALQKKLAEVQAHLDGTQAQLADAQEGLAEAHAEAESAKARAAELEKELEQARDLHSTELAGARELHATELDGARELHAQEVTGVRGELSTVQHEHAKATEELSSVREQHAAVQTDLARLNGDLETVRAEMQTLAGEKELLADEREELKKQVTDALTMAAQNEDRAVKAYQKIKGDERLRERTRKALAIALQLLDEAPAVEALDEERSTQAKQSA